MNAIACARRLRGTKKIGVDWDPLSIAAKENFPGHAIHARVPAQKALEWENWTFGPMVAVAACGDVVLCLENDWWA